MKRHARHNGFTLIELVIVMMIITTALAVAAPSMRGWSRGSQLRDAGDQFLAVCRFARTQAIGDSRVYRLSVDSASGRYWLLAQDGESFANLGSDLGRMFTVPSGFAIAMTDEQEAALEWVEFYPNGRTHAARVRIASSTGDSVEIVCSSPAETFQIASAREQVR